MSPSSAFRFGVLFIREFWVGGRGSGVKDEFEGRSADQAFKSGLIPWSEVSVPKRAESVRLFSKYSQVIYTYKICDAIESRNRIDLTFFVCAPRRPEYILEI